MKQSPEDAFGALDINNQRIVLFWCKQWGFKIPEVIVNFVNNPLCGDLYKE